MVIRYCLYPKKFDKSLFFDILTKKDNLIDLFKYVNMYACLTLIEHFVKMALVENLDKLFDPLLYAP